MSVVLALLDWSLALVHGLVVLAVLVLWIPRSLRRVHLGLVAATLVSWLGLGAYYGFGYCILTDWQWAVKRARGISPLPHSFVHHVLVDCVGLPLSTGQVDTLSAVVLGCVVVLSVALNCGVKFTARAAAPGIEHSSR